MPLCIKILFGSPQRDSVCFWRLIAVTSDHLGISCDCKSLKASCVCVEEVQTRVFSVFISSAKLVHLQCQKCLSPGKNTFVASDTCKCCLSAVWYRIRRWMAEAISLLAINAFVCCVIWCLEVSSRDYLVASNKCILLEYMISYLEVKRVVFEYWFRNIPKKVKKLGWIVSEETSFWVRMELKKVHKQGKDEKDSRTLPN